jgi:mobilization protein NikA
MARHKRSYTGERRTQHVGFYLTPSELAELDAAAAQQGATRSDYARELVFRRMAGPGAVAGTRRNPEAAAIMRSLNTAANENSANGNLMNQIARHLNTTEELGGFATELREALAVYERVAELHILALERVLAL